MLFSFNWLQSFFEKKLPSPKKLAELLTIHSFEVEELRKAGRERVFDIDILSNRVSDCGGHIGIAREIGAIINAKQKILRPKSQLKAQKLKTDDFISVEVKDKNACSRYTSKIITDVKVGESPKYIQERLQACGLRPINNIVAATNYVMLETGQPLHAFDFDKITGKKIIVRKAKKGEEIISLDNDKYILDTDILVIADSKGPLAIAGIKGGRKAEIGKDTKTIVLEAANFEMRTIRKARQKLKLQTDASLRFEHCLDPNLTEIAINRVAGLIQEIAKGKSAQGTVDFYPKKALPKKVKLDLSYVEKLLGVKIPEKEVKNILNKLGFETTQVRPGHIMVTVPTFRLDISIQEDLIEEIGRIYGYDKVTSSLPIVTLIPPKRNDAIFWQDIIKDILKEVGFTEVYNYSFISENDAEIFKSKNLMEVENPLSEEQKYLRPSLITNLLKNVWKNQRYFDEIKIFEIGNIYRQIPKTGIDEKTMFTGVVARKEAKQGFYEAKGVVDTLLNKLGISDCWYDEYEPTPEDSKAIIWHSKRCAEIKTGRQEIGFLGEISSKLLEKLNIKGKVVVFDIDFPKLTKLCSEESEYQPISRYPSAVRDLAILTPKGVKVVEVLNRINIAGKEIVRDVDLFDIYEGRELPDGKKNLAFHIIYQAEDRTLSAQEIDEVHNKIIKLLEEELEWEVRK